MISVGGGAEAIDSRPELDEVMRILNQHRAAAISYRDPDMDCNESQRLA